MANRIRDSDFEPNFQEPTQIFGGTTAQLVWLVLEVWQILIIANYLSDWIDIPWLFELVCIACLPTRQRVCLCIIAIIVYPLGLRDAIQEQRYRLVHVLLETRYQRNVSRDTSLRTKTWIWVLDTLNVRLRATEDWLSYIQQSEIGQAIELISTHRDEFLEQIREHIRARA